MTDHLGSTRGLYDGGKSALGGYEYSPYGELYASSGSVALEGLAAAFTGKPWDAAAQMYYFPYRWYSPSAARWLTRDLLGMVDGPNAHVRCSPMIAVDPFGLLLAPIIAGAIGGCFVGIIRAAILSSGTGGFGARTAACACLGGAIAGAGKGWLGAVTSFFGSLAECLCNGKSLECCAKAAIAGGVSGFIGKMLAGARSDALGVDERTAEFLKGVVGGSASMAGSAIAQEECCD